MSSVKLEWNSAEVKDARLTVGLGGEVSKDWKQSFERTVRLLGDGEWGEVELKKGSVQVSDVEPGTEDKLRHHLEAIVAQANADQEKDDSDGDGDEHGDGKAGEPQGPDAEMTGRFREFADAEDDDGDEEEEGD
jgi:hypothetical protein